MARKYVLTIREDYLVKNNKTEAMVSELLGILGEYGFVESYDDVIAKINLEKEEEVEALRAEIENYKLRNVSDGEAKIINLVRDLVESGSAVYKAKYDNLKSRVESAQMKMRLTKDSAMRKFQEVGSFIDAISTDVGTVE